MPDRNSLVWAERPTEALEPPLRSRAEFERERFGRAAPSLASRCAPPDPRWHERDAGVVVYVAPTAREAVYTHGRASHDEQGGVLLGRVWRDADDSSAALAPAPGPQRARYLVEVEASLPAEGVEATGVSFRFGRTTWERLLARWRSQRSDLELVGWYHTHPDLGAFFSGTDRATQRDLFTTPWMLGLVVDPFRNEEAWFAGPASMRVGDPCILSRPTAAGLAAVPCVGYLKRVRVDADGRVILLLRGRREVRLAGAVIELPAGRAKPIRRIEKRVRALLGRACRRTDRRIELVACVGGRSPSGGNVSGEAFHAYAAGRHLCEVLLQATPARRIDAELESARTPWNRTPR